MLFTNVLGVFPRLVYFELGCPAGLQDGAYEGHMTLGGHLFQLTHPSGTRRSIEIC